MTIITHQLHTKRVAEIVSDTVVIASAAEGFDLLVQLYYQEFDKIIVREAHITPLFFDLTTGIAGELLQKYANYRMQLAIVGTFDQLTGNSIRQFMHESNKTGLITFVPTLEHALC